MIRFDSQNGKISKDCHQNQFEISIHLLFTSMPDCLAIPCRVCITLDLLRKKILTIFLNTLADLDLTRPTSHVIPLSQLFFTPHLVHIISDMALIYEEPFAHHLYVSLFYPAFFASSVSRVVRVRNGFFRRYLPGA